MTIKRYENVKIKTVATTTSSLGEQTTAVTEWFESRALVSDVANQLRISERYRVYADLVNFMFNYTPNMKTIVDNQDQYSFEWRGKNWRITDCRETNDRQYVSFVCYRNDPVVPV